MHRIGSIIVSISIHIMYIKRFNFVNNMRNLEPVLIYYIFKFDEICFTNCFVKKVFSDSIL